MTYNSARTLAAWLRRTTTAVHYDDDDLTALISDRFIVTDKMDLPAIHTDANDAWVNLHDANRDGQVTRIDAMSNSAHYHRIVAHAHLAIAEYREQHDSIKVGAHEGDTTIPEFSADNIVSGTIDASHIELTHISGPTQWKERDDEAVADRIQEMRDRA